MKKTDVSLTSPMPRGILIFAYKPEGEHHLVRKLSLKVELMSIFYAAKSIQEIGYSVFLKSLFSFIEEHQIQFVFLCADFYPAIDVNFIRKLPGDAKKILLTFDDIVMHEVNSITASACDLVLSADPVSVLKYQEKGIEAELISFEASDSIYKVRKTAKDIDVLFFGAQDKADRKAYLEYLRNMGIKITMVGHNKESFLTPEKLGEYISRAKIVLNFSKTLNLQHTEMYCRIYGELIHMFHPFEYYMQLKGRIIEAALSKTVYISEDAPSIRLLFPENDALLFKTQEECFSILTEFLADDAKRESFAVRLYQKASENYEDSVQMDKIGRILTCLKKRLTISVNVPFWYYKLCMNARFDAMKLLWKKPSVLLREILFFLSEKIEISCWRFILLAMIVSFHILHGAVKKLLEK